MAKPTTARDATRENSRAKRPATLDHLRKKQAPWDWHQVVVDPGPVNELSEARAELERFEGRYGRLAGRGGNKDADVVKEAERKVKAAQRRVEEAQAAAADAVAWVKLKAISPHRWDDLIGDHQASEKQHEAAREAGEIDADDRLGWDPETFPKALIAECWAEPKLTPVEFEELYESDAWIGAEKMALFSHALRLCNKRLEAELGKG